MRRRRHLLPKLCLLLALVIAIGAPLWLGAVPARYLPFPAIDLTNPPALLLDFRLASLRRDPQTCAGILKPPVVVASPIPDKPLSDGCGWENAVRVRQTAGTALGADRITCEAAVALALWLAHEVQPLAMAQFGQRVVGVTSMGTYSCRNIVGNAYRPDRRSEHATANAVDIGGFTLGDGRHISVRRHWRQSGAESESLKKAHARACRYFRVALSPEFNAAHHDHLHLDRGRLWTCR